MDNLNRLLEERDYTIEELREAEERVDILRNRLYWIEKELEECEKALGFGIWRKEKGSEV